ncbi:hypothetical protein [Pedobacter alpinus]|uniref:Uncharacterized protein n=1 Tax=Pedobacter alpinus TaxID=1590643 RepID=A0ABW5TPG2_9SPHI
MQNSLGFKRFEKQLEKLDAILSSAKASENSTILFYKSDARQVLFYLEALSRLYKNIHNKNLFDGLKDEFKCLEDQLGKIDYYENYQKELASIPNFPTKLLEHLQKHHQIALEKLGNLLKDDDWFKTKLKDISSELSKADWLKPKEERKEIAKEIFKEIKDIEKDYETGKLNFNYLEEGVHEFRRQIRWISIYAQALDGVIQLKPDDLAEKLRIYLTKEVVGSKFIVMPTADGSPETIQLSQSAFYALSWMIARIGDLKDEGLKLICVEECMREINYLPEEEIQDAAKKLIPNLKITPKQIKIEMKTLVDKFINDDKVLAILRNDLKSIYKD